MKPAFRDPPPNAGVLLSCAIGAEVLDFFTSCDSWVVCFALPGVRKGFIKNKALELVLSKSSTRKKWGGMGGRGGGVCWHSKDKDSRSRGRLSLT